MRLMAYALCVVTVLGLLTVSPPGAAAYDPGWGIAQIIETLDEGDVAYPQVAVDSHGNAIAVWIQSDGVTQSIMSNRYVKGVGWGTAELIETRSGPCGGPQVAVDAAGNAVAVWLHDDAAAYSIWSNRYVVDVGWGGAEPIEFDNTHDADVPHVGMDQDGNAIAVWTQYDGMLHNALSNRYVVGVGWGTPMIIESHNLGDVEDPIVSVNSEGDAVAVWPQFDGVSWSIAANTYVVGSGWGTAEVIETLTGTVGFADVAMDDSGDAFAVWHQWDGLIYNIWANRYVAGDGWDTAELLETDDFGDAVRARVVVDEDGNAIAVWQTSDGAQYSIWSNRYTAGQGWGTAELLETDDTGQAQNPTIDMNEAGDAFVVWHQFDGVRVNIVSNRYAVGEGWGTAELVETSNSGGAYAPEVAVDSDGNAIAVWHQVDGLRYSAWSNRYVAPDTTPPSLSLSSPSDGQTVETPTVPVFGTTEPGVTLVVNGISSAVGGDGSFSIMLALEEGSNDVVVTATDEAGNSATVTRTVTYSDPVVALEQELDDASQDLSNLSDVLDGVSDDLADTRDELDAANDDIASLRSQSVVLIAIVVVLAVLAGVMTFMYMGLRKKTAP